MSTALNARKRSKSLTSSIVELVIIVAVALGLALAIQAFIVKPYRIPSGSMEPTLSIGQRVLVEPHRHGLRRTPASARSWCSIPPEGAESERCGKSMAPGEAVLAAGRQEGRA